MIVPNYEHNTLGFGLKKTNLKSKPELQKLRLEFGEGLNREVEFIIGNPKIELNIGMNDLIVKYRYLGKNRLIRASWSK